jgi:DNA-binding transcriptional MocR family regulator
MPVNSFDNYPLSWKPDRKNLKAPYYRSLAMDLEGKIRSGRLREGTKLPPQREIADYLDLNYTTITRVYDLCRRKGLIYGVVGSGTFVAPHSAEDITIVSQEGQDGVIEMAAVNGFEEYSGPVEQATRSVISRGYLRNLYEYSYPAGQPHQKAAGVRWMEQLGVHASAENTAIFSGAQNALAVAMISLFSPGNKIAADEYTYSNFIELARLLHLELIPVRQDQYGMIPGELAKLCTLHKISGIYLIPTQGNPTTITIPLSRRRELAGVIAENHLTLVEDDIASWLSAAGGSVIPSMYDLLNGHSVYICGMTKSLCTGLRVAYMTFGPEFRDALLHGLLNVNIKTSALDAEIITELILSGAAYSIAARKRAWAERNCRIYAEYFPVSRIEPLYYEWLPIRTDKPPLEIENGLLSRGVRIYHSRRFTAGRGGRQAWLRVSLCSAESTQKLRKGLAILKEYLAENHLLTESEDSHEKE